MTVSDYLDANYGPSLTAASLSGQAPGDGRR